MRKHPNTQNQERRHSPTATAIAVDQNSSLLLPLPSVRAYSFFFFLFVVFSCLLCAFDFRRSFFFDGAPPSPPLLLLSPCPFFGGARQGFGKFQMRKSSIPNQKVRILLSYSVRSFLFLRFFSIHFPNQFIFAFPCIFRAASIFALRVGAVASACPIWTRAASSVGGRAAACLG